MMLNEQLEFFSIPVEVKRAFLGIPDKVVLKAGTRLYKWSDHRLPASHGAAEARSITPWWSYYRQTVLPGGLVVEGFNESRERARALRVSHRDYQRVRSAVSERFNNRMRHLLLIELLQDVWGFAGTASGQPEFKDPALANVYLIGGQGQLWVPNLTLRHVAEIPAPD